MTTLSKLGLGWILGRKTSFVQCKSFYSCVTPRGLDQSTSIKVGENLSILKARAGEIYYEGTSPLFRIENNLSKVV